MDFDIELFIIYCLVGAFISAIVFTTVGIVSQDMICIGAGIVSSILVNALMQVFS